MLKHVLVRRLLPRVLTCARSVLPRRRYAFVTGYPSTEGNVVETVRALSRRYTGTIWWAQAPSAEYLHAVGIPQERVRRVVKGSPLTMLRYATAELVLFTHGVYGEPSANPRKPIVNLWHGAGIKQAYPLFPNRRLRGRPSDLVVAPSRVWGGRNAEASGLADDDTLFVGYPRNDQLFRPAGSGDLERLGITGDFVVWLPSFRTVGEQGTMLAQQDGIDVAGDQQLTEDFGVVVAALARHGVQTLVKPHPMDVVARAVPGTVVVDDEQLEHLGLPLYAVLGAARGLISDHSSAWGDFLLLDRPIGFFFPDRHEFARGRGVYPPDALDWLPGPFLDTPAQIEDFVRSLSGESREERARRQHTIDRAGVVQTDRAADVVLDELGDRYPHLARRIVESPGGAS